MKQEKTEAVEHMFFTDEEVEWFKSKGCRVVKQPVKKGGMILWDSRLVHQGSPPKRGRQHPGRWRFVTYVCMGPAAWATEKDLSTKKRAYQNLKSTAHWPSRDVVIMDVMDLPDDEQVLDKRLPDIALTDKAKKLAGVSAYDFNDGKGNGPPLPQYRS